MSKDSVLIMGQPNGKTHALFGDKSKELDVEKFVRAHHDDFETALREIKGELKISHWMWYIFPQIKGLGGSMMANMYGLKNIEHARLYMDNETLKNNMFVLCDALLKTKKNDPSEIFGYPDDLKLHSCMTLFAVATPDYKCFQDVINKFYGGEKDEGTIRIIKNHDGEEGWDYSGGLK